MITANIEEIKGDLSVDHLPKPVGYHLLVFIPTIKETTEGGVFLTESTRRLERQASPVAYVMKLGDMAYKDPAKFPTGPWCAEGDWILIKPFAGRSFFSPVEGKLAEFRIIADDWVMAVTSTPGAVVRTE